MADTESEVSLAHLSWLCPGMHGKESRQTIVRKTFRQLFQSEKRLIIPLIQRRYCWNQTTLWRWFEDVVRGQRDHLGVHNTGNVVLKTSQHGDGFIVVDGQQRITTAMLLLAALRDEVRGLEMKEERAEYRALLSTLDHVLFLTPSTDTNTTNTNYQEFLQTSRLVPSFYDRRPYFGLISKDSNSLSDSEDVSYQLMARQLFTSRIQEEVARLQSSNPGRILEKYQEIARQQLDLFGITFVEILNEVNLAQEKSLLGEAALVFNPAPGLFFTGVDMIRNLILAPVIDLSMEQQEEFHKTLWLDPVESFFPGQENSAEFNKTLNEFVTERTKKSEEKSKGELTYEAAVKGSKFLSPESRLYITTYAKFITLLENITLGIAEEEKHKNIKASEILSSDLSSFIKIRSLKRKIKDGM